MTASGESVSQTKLPLGLSATSEKDVSREWTLAAFDPKLPPVLSTPAMIGLMEVTAAKAVQPSLPAGAITVGTRIEVDHLKAVSDGARIISSAKLVSQEGRFLVFAGPFDVHDCVTCNSAFTFEFGSELARRAELYIVWKKLIIDWVRSSLDDEPVGLQHEP